MSMERKVCAEQEVSREQQKSLGRNDRKKFSFWRAGLFALAVAAAFSVCARAADERAIKTRVAPVYPELAKRMRIGGVVKLEVTVGADGKVSDVKALSGNQVLQIAAEDAVRKWRFAPGSGQSIVDVNLNFEVPQ
jgi:TonB family protein